MGGISTLTANDIYGAAAGRARCRIEVNGGDLKFLNRILGEVLGGSAIDPVIDGGTVHRNASLKVLRAVDRDSLVVVAESAWVGGRHDSDSGFEAGEFQKVPAIE